MTGYSPEKMGQRLRQVRNQLGFGLRAFCREYNLSPSVWCRLERGLQTQHVKSMVTLCEEFNIAPTWLLFGVGPQTIAHKMPPPGSRRSKKKKRTSGVGNKNRKQL